MGPLEGTYAIVGAGLMAFCGARIGQAVFPGDSVGNVLVVGFAVGIALISQAGTLRHGRRIADLERQLDTLRASLNGLA